MHTIRLRGPWRYEVRERLAGDASHARSGKQKMPADWSSTLGADFRGTVRYSRVFHQPTGLEPEQQVWLVIDGVDSTAEITLNDTKLPACGAAPHNRATSGSNSWRHEIQHLLSDNCELIIDVTHPPEAEEAGGLTGEVRLEIQTVRPRPVD